MAKVFTMQETIPVKFDFSQYYQNEHVINYDPEVHGVLEKEFALELINRLYQSNWFLSPLFDGTFADANEAICFVDQIPNEPLYIVFPTDSHFGCVNALVSHCDGVFSLSEEEHFEGNFKQFKSIQELIEGALDFAQQLAQKWASDDTTEIITVCPFDKD